MTIGEACRRLGISRTAFYKWEDAGKIKVERKGRATQVTAAEVQKRLAEMKAEKYWQERNHV